MNIQESDILNILLTNGYTNQRTLSEISGHSLGIVNRSIKSLMDKGYLDSHIHLTPKALQEIHANSPKNAIILAAGFGMRMIPINTEVPKGLLEIHGEPLIERIIKQLHEAGIHKIYIVVGFMKEQYEYLMDTYGVELIVNTEYTLKNNLYSLKSALKYVSNSYIIPCDIWCKNNPFNHYELYSWYMVSDSMTYGSTVRINRKMELVSISDAVKGNKMTGISYLCNKEAAYVCKRIHFLASDSRNDNIFWEDALYQGDKMIVYAKVIHHSEIAEINTYEQLRELDSNSNQLKSETIDIAAKVLNTTSDKITDISVLKKGMTNRSFLFKCRSQKYIMRIPGEGTEKLISRSQEAQVYHVIKDQHICDDILYINPCNGYKLTTFFNNARVCNPLNADDVRKCMLKLRSFHEMDFKVEHKFDLFKQIDFYEHLWNSPSVYKDYNKTKTNILSLRNYIESQVTKETLTHIDAVPDNFLFIKTSDSSEEIRLIDWEYAGMQDPHIDIAMFCIYSLYNRQQIDQTIQFYFTEGCPNAVKIKIYCYIAACGLLWSNWCEYKRKLGIDFGEYSLRQYRYAKDYYRLVQNKLNTEG